jgi:hypothetical protein
MADYDVEVAEFEEFRLRSMRLHTEVMEFVCGHEGLLACALGSSIAAESWLAAFDALTDEPARVAFSQAAFKAITWEIAWRKVSLRVGQLERVEKLVVALREVVWPGGPVETT